MCDSGDGLPGGGRLAGLTAADCYACPVGQFASGNNYTCSACPAGSFTDEVGMAPSLSLIACYLVSGAETPQRHCSGTHTHSPVLQCKGACSLSVL